MFWSMRPAEPCWGDLSEFGWSVSDLDSVEVPFHRPDLLALGLRSPFAVSTLEEQQRCSTRPRWAQSGSPGAIYVTSARCRSH